MNADDLQRAVATTRTVLAAVRPAQLDNQTPCGSWTVCDLIIHMIDAPIFTAVVMETGDWANHSYDPIDPAVGDYLARYDAATSRLVAAFRTEGAGSKMVKMPVVGPLPGASLNTAATCDAFVHGWDLAKATGVPTDLDPEFATAVLYAIRPLVTEEMRGSEGKALFGLEVKVPLDASPADKLAGFLGRRP